MKWLVLLNESAGTIAKSDDAGTADIVRDHLSALGVSADVRAVAPAELTDAARAAATSGAYDAVVAGGGDGTLNAVAAGVAGTGVPFGALPLGTHNHFIKDLGTPLELPDAIASLVRGRVAELPVGHVNGHLFLNFVGIGLHPRIVKHRDAQRKSLDRGKWTAMFVAMAKAMVDFPLMRVRLTIDGQTVSRLTPSVILCNNAHQMRAFGVENASYPDRRLLNVYVARSRGRWSLVWLMLKALVGRLEETATFEVLATSELRVDMRERTVRVSIDGEVIDLTSPLEFTVEPARLKVILPRGE